MSSFEACRQVTEVAPSTRVIVLTAKLSNEEVVSSMMSGAAGYLPVNSLPMDLVRTVRSNGRGELLLVRPVAERALKLLWYNKRLVDVNCLTVRERQILVLVAQGLSNREIGAMLIASPLTIRNHISRIFTKLAISRRAQLGAYAPLIGVLDVNDADDQ